MNELSIAPMIDWTNTYFRRLMRLLCPKALLYTEMFTANAVVHGSHRVSSFISNEHPLVIQLGGNCPKLLAQAAAVAESIGYDQINLNVGCPSSRVQAGAFGACLMNQPELVADCVAAMKQCVDIPVTVKTRTGIDTHDSLDFLNRFIETVKQAECETFIIHARNAWLKGLNPKQNRTVPPLQYGKVYQIKSMHPELGVIINGGINDYSAIREHLSRVDGVMLGRLAINDPYQLAEIHAHLFGNALPKRREVIAQYLTYCRQTEGLKPVSLVLKPLFALFNGKPGAKQWRQYLTQSQQAKKVDYDEILEFTGV